MSGESGSYPTAGAVDAERVGDVEALRLIVEGTAAGTGKQFFDALVRHLAVAVGTGYAFVAEFLGGTRARTLAYWKKTELHPDPV
jgi:hypothetical protein